MNTRRCEGRRLLVAARDQRAPTHRRRQITETEANDPAAARAKRSHLPRVGERSFVPWPDYVQKRASHSSNMPPHTPPRRPLEDQLTTQARRSHGSGAPRGAPREALRVDGPHSLRTRPERAPGGRNSTAHAEQPVALTTRSRHRTLSSCLDTGESGPPGSGGWRVAAGFRYKSSRERSCSMNNDTNVALMK